MKTLFVVLGNTIDFRKDGKLTVPTAAEFRQLIAKDIAGSKRNGFDAFLAFETFEDAVKVANEFDAERKSDEGFPIVQIQTKLHLDNLKRDEYQAQIDKDTKQVVEGYLIPFTRAKRVGVIVSHLDAELKDSNVALFKNIPIVVSPTTGPVVPTPVEPVKSVVEKNNRLRNAVAVLSLAAIGVGLTLSGVTPALLATYAGVELSMAAMLGLSVAATFTAAAVGYGLVKGASAAARLVFGSSKDKQNAETSEPAAPDAAATKDAKTAENVAEAALNAGNGNVVDFARKAEQQKQADEKKSACCEPKQPEVSAPKKPCCK